MSNKPKTERTPEEIEAAKQRKLANLKRFRKMEELTPEEQKEQMQIINAGGLANKQRIEKQQSINELAKALLNTVVSRERAKNVIGEDIELLDGQKVSVAEVLNVCMMQEAIKGNYHAYETLRDTAGYSPKQQIEISADITTDADRALMEKLNSRLIAQKAL